jgi:hypothetical protein
LIEAGADVSYSHNGYDVLIDAAHGRDVFLDTRLLDLVRLLIAHGATPRVENVVAGPGAQVRYANSGSVL